jgi:hypothetical protein
LLRQRLQKTLKLPKPPGFTTVKVNPDQDDLGLFAINVVNNNDEDVVLNGVNFTQVGVKTSFLKSILVETYIPDGKFFSSIIGHTKTGTGEASAETPLHGLIDMGYVYSYAPDAVVIPAHGNKYFGIGVSLSPRAKVNQSFSLRIDSISLVKKSTLDTLTDNAAIQSTAFLVKTPVSSSLVKVLKPSQPSITLLYPEYGISACSLSDGSNTKCRIAWHDNTGDSQVKIYFVTPQGPIKTWTAPNNGFFDILPQDIPFDVDFTVLVTGAPSNISAASTQNFHMSFNHSSNSYP